LLLLPPSNSISRVSLLSHSVLYSVLHNIPSNERVTLFSSSYKSFT
jgi:hypothetical protein